MADDPTTLSDSLSRTPSVYVMASDTMQSDTPPARRGLLACPQELIDQILAEVTIKEFISLRLVCLDYYRYFTDPQIVAYAHCLYFPRSSALLGGGSNYKYRSHVLLENGTSELTPADFESAHRRARRWQKQTPATVRFIDDVLDGSVTNSPNAIFVAEAEGLLVYQRDVGVIVIVDLNGHLRSGFPREQVVDLRALLGPCIAHKSEMLRPGAPSQEIQMRLSKGTLLVIGQRHTHQMGGEAHGSMLQSRLFHPFSSRQEPNIQRSITHTMCAVISLLPQDRGQVLHAWFDPGQFILASCHNPYYALIEFDIEDNQLRGLVFPERTVKSKRSSFLKGSGSPPGLGARFEILKRTHYPAASVFKIASDDSGQHFFVGFTVRGTNVPIIEVHSVPKLQPDGSYSPATVIKRVALLHGMQTGLPGHNTPNRSSFKFNFENVMDLTQGSWDLIRGYQDGGEVVSGVKHLHLPKSESAFDRIRVRMSGFFSQDDPARDTLNIDKSHYVGSISWEVDTCPSPRKPSTALIWNRTEGKISVEYDQTDAKGTLIPSPFLDSSNSFDPDQAYPSPTFYLRPHPTKTETLKTLPAPPFETFSLDTLLANGTLIEHPHQSWRYDSPEQATLCTTFYTPLCLPHQDTSRLPYPPTPGKNDRHFIPPSRLLLASHLTSLTTGRWTTLSPPRTKPDPLGLFLAYFANPMTMTSLTAAIGLSSPSLRGPSNPPAAPLHTFLPSPLPQDESASEKAPKTLGKMDSSGDRRWAVYAVPSRKRYTGWEGNSQGQVGQYDGERIVVVRFDE